MNKINNKSYYNLIVELDKVANDLKKKTFSEEDYYNFFDNLNNIK